MPRPRRQTPPDRWASLIQNSLADEATRSAAERTDADKDAREASDVVDLIAKAASEVEHHRDAAVAVRLQFKAMHKAASALQAKSLADEKPGQPTGKDPLPEPRSGPQGLDVRR